MLIQRRDIFAAQSARTYAIRKSNDLAMLIGGNAGCTS
jgi:hypothetical protein